MHMFKHRDDIITNRNRMFYGISTIREECFGYKNIFGKIKNIPRYIRRVHYLKKYGYDKGALWETFDWFTKTMRDILIQYRYHHCSNPVVIDNYPYDSSLKDENSKQLRESNEDTWDGIIDNMIELLDLMDEDNPKYHTADRNILENDKKQVEAKNEFFELFSKYFFELWD